MTAATAVRILRALGLLVAAVAAVVVFVSVGDEGGSDWQIRALVFIGVLVLILHVATSSWVSPPTEITTEVVEYFPVAEHLLHASPNHLPDPTAAEARIQPSDHSEARSAQLPTHPDLPGLVVPATAFPDAGHAHGPVLAVNDDQPLPPLHAVLRPAAPTDAVLLDLRSDRGEEQIVYPIASTSDPDPMSGPHPLPSAPPGPSGPPPVAPPEWAPPQDWSAPGPSGTDGQVPPSS